MKKINFITLGCSKNIVDSEHIMAQLHSAGYEIINDSDSLEGIDIAIVNTCGFIADAKQESIDLILRLAEARKLGIIEKVYIFGCLSERYKKELEEEIPEIDSYFGARDLTEIVRELTGQWKEGLDQTRLLTTPGHYAYLKISEGCNWSCGYCAIPLIRGRYRSVPEDILLKEATQLASQGVRELILIGQDTTYYGMDIHGRRTLAGLMDKLCGIDGIRWIRLHYAYPTHFPTDVLEVMASQPKICKYLDIPFQHISDNQLSSMKRGITKTETYELITRIREIVPDITLRTTLLTGYPGETEDDFSELMEFVRKVRFDRLGVFPYSEEEGTYSAEKLCDDISEESKMERADKLMALQREISFENNRSLVGKEQQVIVDSIEGEYLICRSGSDSPEVDQEILVEKNDRTKGIIPGDFINIIVTGAEEYDLYARML